MSRVELYERIRKDNRDDGLSIRALADRYHVHRRTVREALASATPPARKVAERDSVVLGPWMEVIRSWLVADRSVPRKQRHTARRVHQRLSQEYGATLAESTVRAFVAQVNFELDNTLFAVTVPQTHSPGAEAEVDFGEFVAFIGGVLVKCQMFCMRLSYSGAGFHMAFSHQAQEAFFEGHVRAFAHLGGYVGDCCQGASSSSRVRSPSKIFWRPTWPLETASSRCRRSVGRNSIVVTKNEQDSQIDSKWQSNSTGRAQ